MPPLQALRIVLGLTMPIRADRPLHRDPLRVRAVRASASRYSRIIAGALAERRVGLALGRLARAGSAAASACARSATGAAGNAERSLRRRPVAAGARGRRLLTMVARSGRGDQARRRWPQLKPVNRPRSGAQTRCWCTSRKSPGSASAAAGAASWRRNRSVWICIGSNRERAARLDGARGEPQLRHPARSMCGSRALCDLSRRVGRRVAVRRRSTTSDARSTGSASSSDIRLACQLRPTGDIGVSPWFLRVRPAHRAAAVAGKDHDAALCSSASASTPAAPRRHGGARHDPCARPLPRRRRGGGDRERRTCTAVGVELAARVPAAGGLAGATGRALTAATGSPPLPAGASLADSWGSGLCGARPAHRPDRGRLDRHGRRPPVAGRRSTTSNAARNAAASGATSRSRDAAERSVSATTFAWQPRRSRRRRGADRVGAPSWRRWSPRSL